MSIPGRALLLSCGGLGYLRPAPGTWGSLPPAGLVFVMLLAGAPYWSVQVALIAVLVASSIICVALGSWGERHFGRKDASNIVIDETAGQCMPLLFWPAGFVAQCKGIVPEGAVDVAAVLRAMAAVGGAFILFRIFDIIKPPPAHGLQRLKGGVGVLVDDLIAGLYAAIVVQIPLWLLV
jgi:phosphatidylglycerophosphatase A